MKKTLIISAYIILLSVTACHNKLLGQTKHIEYIISKHNGRIILAYKLFEAYLTSDRTWKNYKTNVLDACPEMQEAHDKAVSWGTIDSVKFRNDVTGFKKEDWDKYFEQYNIKTLNYLFDTLISKADMTLPPLTHKPVDLCLFLPYGGCYIIPGNEKNTIFISLFIDPVDAPKIMIHEYAHNLHIQRRPLEPFNLHREIVSEGMAVYLTTLILNDPGLTKSIPFMTESSVQWCFANEHIIKASIKSELNDTTFNCLKKFIADGAIATPPKGFVEKTGYFVGFRIIEACIKKGMKLEDICKLDSDEVITHSGYFN